MNNGDSRAHWPVVHEAGVLLHFRHERPYLLLAALLSLLGHVTLWLNFHTPATAVIPPRPPTRISVALLAPTPRPAAPQPVAVPPPPVVALQPPPVAPPPPRIAPKTVPKPAKPKPAPVTPPAPPVAASIEQPVIPSPPIMASAAPAPASAAPVVAPPVEETFTRARQAPGNAKPMYPLAARRMSWEGTVLLEVQVLPSGRCGTVKVLKSSGHESLDKAAIKAVEAWEFVPAHRGATTVASSLTLSIVFRLDN